MFRFLQAGRSCTQRELFYRAISDAGKDSRMVVVSNIFGIVTPKIGEDEPNLTSIFLKWVGSTTNY